MADPPSIASLMAIGDAAQLTVPGLNHPPDKVPRPYQKIDAAAALLHKRLIVGEYAGSGKKLIAILAILKAFDLMEASRVGIISLGSDVTQWVEDLHEFTEGINIQTYRGAKAERYRMLGMDYDIRVMSYQTAVSDYAWLMGYFDILILDEVSYLKNPESMASMTVSALTAPTHQEQLAFMKWRWDYEEEKAKEREEKKKRRYAVRPFPGWTPQGPTCKFVWPLSATPMETGPMDLFSVAKATFGRQSPLGTNTESFKRNFCKVKTFKVKVPRYGPRGRVIGQRTLQVEKVAGFKSQEAKETCRQLLFDQNRIVRHPFSIIEKYLPPIEVLPVWLNMTGKQALRYQQITDDDNVVFDMAVRESGRLLTKKQVNAALKLFYQLRCCDGLTSLPGQEGKDSVKRDWVMSMLLGELGDQKVIVFSRFHDPLDQLQEKHNYEDRPWVRIDGNHDDYQNDEARKTFVGTSHPMTLFMTGKGSYALNLQAECNYGIAYNTLFNPKKLEQLYGRNRRPKPGHVGAYDESHKVVWYHPLIANAIPRKGIEIPTSEQAQWVILQEREQDFKDIFGLADELFTHLPDHTDMCSVLRHEMRHRPG